MRYRRVLTGAFINAAKITAGILLLISLPTYGQDNKMNSANEPPYKEGELIVQLSAGIAAKSVTNDFSDFNLQLKKLLSRRMNIWLFEYDATDMKIGEHASLLSSVRSHKNVDLAQFNHYVKLRSTFPNDPDFSNQWNMHNTGQSGGTVDADIDAPEAWDITTGDTTSLGDQIVVAIIDGGIDLSHEDLSLFKNVHEIPANGIDDDANGYIDDYDGWDAYSSDGTIPSSSHGTHVAGIAAAVGNNGIGVSGVNWGAKVLPIAGSSGTESIVVEAYGYALEMRATYNETDGAKGAFIVSTNSSFGVDYGDPADFPVWCAMYDSLGAVGILSAAATANININIDIQGDVPTACPSNFLISVTNTTDDDVKNSGAAYGATTIDLGAPGTSIRSTIPSSDYGYMTGTSMASPHVAGAVALMYGAVCPSLLQLYKSHPDSVALIIKQYVMDGTDPIPSLQGVTVSDGRLNIDNSLVLVQNHPCGVTIDHTPLTDTRDTLNDYEVVCTITSDTTLVADSLLLYYEISSTWYKDTLEATGGQDEYHGFIPAQSPGTVINYYFYAQDAEGETDTTETYTFQVLDYSLTLEPSFGSDTGAVDDTIWHQLTVTNVGVYTDDYMLTYSGHSWPTSLWDESQTTLVSSSGPLPSDGIFAFTVRVIVPSSMYGDYDSVEVKATSTGGPGIFEVSNLLTVSEGEPLSLPFADNFITTEIDQGKWVLASGATVNDIGLNEPSIPYSANFNGNPNGADTLMSQLIDLAGEANVIVKYFYQRTGGGNSPEPGEDLFVEYLDSTGSWQLLQQHLGADPDMTEFEKVEITLPGPAYHSTFRLRLSNSGTNGSFDDWFVDDIYVGYPPDYEVSISPSFASQYGPAGDSAAYLLTIHNQGLYDDTYDLSDSDGVWEVAFFDEGGAVPISSAGPVMARDSMKVIVKIAIPGSAPMNEADTVEVYAVSQGDPSMAALAVLATVSAGEPGAFPWFEPFPDDTLYRERWITNVGAEVSTEGIAPPSLPYSLNLNGGIDTVVTQLIDLSGTSRVILSYHYERGGGGEAPDAGDDLWVEYKNNVGSWVLINQHPGNEPTMSSFEQVSVDLPADALHSSFQLRLHSYGSGVDYDDWYVDDIRLGETPAISVSPSSFAQTLAPGDSTVEDLIIANAGPGELDYSISLVPVDTKSDLLSKHFEDGRDELALLSTKPYQWLRLSQQEGTLAAAEADTVACTFLTTELDTGVYHLNLVISSNDPDSSDNPWTVPAELTVSSGPSYICGDIDGSGENPNVVDVTYFVTYLFLSGPAPPALEAADVDGSGGDPNVVDLTYLVSYLFVNGPDLNCP